MAERTETESRKLLGRLRDAMAGDHAGQERLDKITHLIATSMGCEVCSIYLFRDDDTLELCATEGLNAQAVHETRMKLGEGLVGRVAKYRRVINTPDAPQAVGFRFMPETGEEIPFDLKSLRDILTYAEIWELFYGLHGGGNVTADDKKK